MVKRAFRLMQIVGGNLCPCFVCCNSAIRDAAGIPILDCHNSPLQGFATIANTSSFVKCFCYKGHFCLKACVTVGYVSGRFVA